MADEHDTTGINIAGAVGTIGETVYGVAMADSYWQQTKLGTHYVIAAESVSSMDVFVGTGKVFGPVVLAFSGMAEFGAASLEGTPEAYGKATGSLLGGIGGSSLAIGAAVAAGIVSAPVSLPALLIGAGGSFVGSGLLGFAGGKIGIVLSYSIGSLAPGENVYVNPMGDMDGIFENRCFPAHTRIQTSRTTSNAISALRVGDVVLAFDARADKGRGALVPRRVTRLYRNTTTEWIRLRWHDGTAREVITTPGHHFLDEFGEFPTIEEMTRTGSATVVLASGALTQVTAERITFCAETAHLFERAVTHVAAAGNAAIQPVELDAWATYNFEVEDLHTYVAEGIRVHNDSGLLGEVGTAIFSAGEDGRGHMFDLNGNVLTIT